MSEKMLDMAEQQILGYSHAKKGYDLTSLVNAMGLTEKEWKSMKKIYDLNYLKPEEITEIDNFFKESRNNLTTLKNK